MVPPFNNEIQIMAYMSKENAARIRKQLKAQFPEFKFSVRNDNHTAISVSILSGPVLFDTLRPEYSQLNNYYPENYENSEILKSMLAIINEGNYDKSDSQTDYFCVGWYVSLNQGQYNRPYKLIE